MYHRCWLSNATFLALSPARPGCSPVKLTVGLLDAAVSLCLRVLAIQWSPGGRQDWLVSSCSHSSFVVRSWLWSLAGRTDSPITYPCFRCHLLQCSCRGPRDSHQGVLGSLLTTLLYLHHAGCPQQGRAAWHKTSHQFPPPAVET